MEGDPEGVAGAAGQVAGVREQRGRVDCAWVMALAGACGESVRDTCGALAHTHTHPRLVAGAEAEAGVVGGQGGWWVWGGW